MAKEKYWLPDPSFPGKQQWPCSFALPDELYQIKDYSRDKGRVLMRLDPSKIDMKNKKVHRWRFRRHVGRNVRQGTVFYSSFGNVSENWDNPSLQKRYTEAIKWALGLIAADSTPRPLNSQP